MAVDGVTAEVTAAFDAAGIPSLLLKGPTLARWLYDGGGRSYADTDLLVGPARIGDARTVLARLGFTPAFGSLPHPGMESPPSAPWVRGPFALDLHETLPGARAPRERVWGSLEEGSVSFEVAGRRVRALGEPARLAHVALHAAHHGPGFRQPLRDLEEALAQVDEAIWVEAGRIADGLGAEDAFAGGLELTAEGRRLLHALGRSSGGAAGPVSRATARIPVTGGLERLRAARGARARARMVAAELFPSRAFMRWWSPLARRSRRGMAAAYLWRVTYLLLRAPAGIRAWRRAGRQSAQFRRTT